MPSIHTQSASSDRTLATEDHRRLQRRVASVSFELDSEGLGDPFAELFAAIATSESAAQLQASPDEPVQEDDASSSVEQDYETTEDQSRDSFQAETTPVLVPVEQESSIEIDDSQQSKTEEAVDPLKPAASASDTQQEPTSGLTEQPVNTEPNPVSTESDAEVVVESGLKAEESKSAELGSAVVANPTSERRRSNRESSGTKDAVPLSSSSQQGEQDGDPLPETTIRETPKTDFGFTNPDRDQGYSRERSPRLGASRRDRHERAPVDHSAVENAERPVGPSVNENRASVSSQSSAEPSIRTLEGSSSTVQAVDRATSTALGIATESRTRNASVTPRGETGSVAKPSATEKSASLNRLLDSPSDRTPGSENAAKSKSKSSSAADLVMRAKLVQRVSKAFQHFGNENGNIRLKLAPAELGSVRVEMQVKDKQVHARVVADNESAAQLLREQLPDLRGRLEAQGMQVDRLTVEQESETTFSFHGDSGQEENQNRWANRDSSHRQHGDGSGRSPSNGASTETDSARDPWAVSHPLSAPNQNPAGVDLLY